MNHYASSWNVIGFLNNNVERKGKKLRGITVFSPDILNKYDLSQVMVFICCLTTVDIF